MAEADYAAAARVAAFERATAWRPEAFESHPRMIGGPIVRVSRFERDDSQATVYTIETKYEHGGTESQVAWAVWAFDPAPEKDPARKTRLLSELGLQVDDDVMCSYSGLKPYTDGSGKTFHAFDFQRVTSTSSESDEVPQASGETDDVSPTSDELGEVPA
jgi:hypothetical protein